MIKTIVKIVLWILLALLIVLGIAYWTAPSWVPGQIQKFLPPSVKLDQLQLQHPGLTSTKVDNITILIGGTDSEDTDSDAGKYRLQLTNTQIHYSLWQQKLTSISAEKARIIMPESTSDSKVTEREVLQKIPLPIIPVPKLDVATIEIEGVTLGTITAKNLTFEEKNSYLSVNTTINFFDHDFTVAAQAERSNESLGKTTLNIQQSKNQVEAVIKPINSLHWEFEANSSINSQDYYPQPGLSTLGLNLNGSVDITNPDKVTINLEPDNTLSAPLNIKELGLQESLINTLQAQNINTNFNSFEPVYSLLLTNKTASTIEYSADTSLLALSQGDLVLSANNSSIQLESIIDKLVLNLNNELTAPSQHISAATKATIKNLKADYTTPTNKASAATVDVQLAATANLEQGQLKVTSDNNRIALSTVNYEGNNSTATISSSDWLIKGLSTLDLPLDQTKPSSAKPSNPKHDWQITSQKPIDGALTLSAEQFNAQKVSINLSYKTTDKRPKGTIHGSYQLAKLSLKQQPLQLTDLKGTLLFAPEISPLSGNLSFSSAQYKNQQIGISNIAGKLDWTKKANRFVAEGKLAHDDSNVPFTYQFDLRSSQHNLKIKQSSFPISTVTNWVKILKDYPELSFNSGQLEINSLDGDPIGLLFDGNIKLDNFNLNYDEFYIKNWSIEDSLTSSSKLGGTLKSHIERIELATDIAITDVSFLMPHTINSLVITNLMGKLLKGTIEIPKLAINEQGIPPFTAYLKSIDIGALLKALNSEKLEIQGLFNFTLPLSISDEGQQIINGKFEALSAGVVKLKSDGKDPNIAFQALENFHYKEFSGTVNYDLEGNYTIELHVLGSNPNLYSGFPIKLDLTLRGELPDLLYSMLVTGDMTKPILDDLEQKQILNIQQ